ncbi:DUF4097 family beta strand repeat-containing protein [Pseudonocardia phyllosphaerae]|uniref:DUF4097 family beta strand repeat-containing protein n=1 Tax=Pseudonocardia phyllosphaerae TaxID=3390502 RepID=UPI00397E7E44
MSAFDTPGPVSATVDLPIGTVRVVAADRPDTVVDVRADSADREQADAVRVDLTGDELRVTGRPLGLLQKLSPRTPGRSLEVVVDLPAGSSLTVRTGYGDVTTEGPLGACDIDARYGDVRIGEAAEARIVAGYGRIAVTGTVDGDATLTADHGGVRAGRIGGTATLRSKHGLVRADELAGPADLTGTHGDIEIDAADADVRARTSYGGVRIGRLTRGEVSLSSTHGRLEAGIAATTAAWLDLDTGARIDNELTAREDPTGFTEKVAVTARSREGDIVIRRA